MQTKSLLKTDNLYLSVARIKIIPTMEMGGNFPIIINQSSNTNHTGSITK